MYPFLKEINSQSLQQANRDLDNAFDRFFNGLGKRPNKKSKKFRNNSGSLERLQTFPEQEILYIDTIIFIFDETRRDSCTLCLKP
jgi:transposase